MHLRLTAARLARFAIRFVIRHSSEENRGYLRHAGFAVEDFVIADPLDERELEALGASLRHANSERP